MRINHLFISKKYAKSWCAGVLTAVAGVTITMGAGLTAFADSNSTVAGSSIKQNQTINPSPQANGDLGYQWGNCSLNLNNGLLTIKAGQLTGMQPDGLKTLFSEGKITAIHVEKRVKLPDDSTNLFAGIASLTAITFEKGIDTSNVTNMTAMFMNDTALTSLDLSSFNTKNVTDMTSMFMGDAALKSLNVSSFDTENVVSMKGMFAGATQLESLDLSSFDTRNAVKNIDNNESGTTYMLGMAGGEIDFLLKNLWKITLGPDTVITDPSENENLKVAGLPDAPGTAANPVSFTDSNFPGAIFQNNGSNWVEAGTSVDGHNPTGTVLTSRQALKDYLAKPRSKSETLVWQQVPAPKQTITLAYIDQSGNQIANPQIFSGYPGTSYNVSNYQLVINGYAFNRVVGSLTGTYSKVPMTITFEYVNNQIGSTIPVTPLTPAMPVPDTSTPTPTTPGQPVEVKYAFPFKVYAKTTVYKYRTVNFKKSQRIRKYVKQPRYKVSVFTVNKAIKNAQGRWRYKVAGGYITTNEKNIGLLYWQSGKYRKLTVINPKGVYESQSRLLAKHNRVQHLKRGTSVRVKAVVHDGMATRYVLNNGHYITGNKKFVSLKTS
ncbi:MAG: DUF5776 domain-containing protein [Lentilactobacillus diolivorans]|nr:DUF5776 domain-containing protein [Lentilactobacillus diolivorans]RRG03213.1 MAG: BspA family leucine-rich repeat surface protein [Lactobacillus sp.]